MITCTHSYTHCTLSIASTDDHSIETVVFFCLHFAPRFFYYAVAEIQRSPIAVPASPTGINEFPQGLMVRVKQWQQSLDVESTMVRHVGAKHSICEPQDQQ